MYYDIFLGRVSECILFSLGSLLQEKIGKDNRSKLEKDLFMEELDWVVYHSHPDKAPGPDGLNMREIKQM